MPTLTQVVTDGDTDRPVAWKCTECDAVFDFGRMLTNPSRERLGALNERFFRHCAEAHAGSGPVVGLEVPA